MKSHDNSILDQQHPSTTKTLTRINKTSELGQTFFITRLKRKHSIVESNKKISIRPIFMDRKLIGLGPSKSSLSYSLYNPETIKVPEKKEESVPKRLKYITAAPPVILKHISCSNEKFIKKDSMLEFLEKSQKLESYMEKLGKPCLQLNGDKLWSRAIHKRRDYFNSTVYNSCILSQKFMKKQFLPD